MKTSGRVVDGPTRNVILFYVKIYIKPFVGPKPSPMVQNLFCCDMEQTICKWFQDVQGGWYKNGSTNVDRHSEMVTVEIVIAGKSEIGALPSNTQKR